MRHFLIPLFASTALGAPAASAQDGELPQFCDKAFYAADRDADGRLTVEEISAQRDARFAEIDLNNDGSIDRVEFTNCVGAANEARIDAFTGGSADYETGKWSDLKLTQKEQLTEQEFAALSEKAWQSSDPALKEAVSIYWQADSEEEFAAGAAFLFDLHDTDFDGVLERAEYEARIDPDTRAREMTDQAWSAANSYGAGELGVTEYREAGLANAYEKVEMWLADREQDADFEGEAAMNENTGSSDAEEVSQDAQGVLIPHNGDISVHDYYQAL